MKRAAIPLLLLLAACGSSSGDANRSRAEVEFEQVYGPGDVGLVRGANTMNIEYAVHIGNRSAEPITLRRISVSSVGTGSYRLRPEEQIYDETIPPDAAGVVKLSARGYFVGTSTGEASREPVTLRAILYFDAPAGSFRRIVTQNIGQFPGAR